MEAVKPEDFPSRWNGSCSGDCFGCLFQAESSPIIVRHDDTPRVMSEQQQSWNNHHVTQQLLFISPDKPRA